MTSNLPAVLPDILFYIFSGLAIAGALMVLIQRNPMSSAVSMVVAVLSIAVLYLLLSAHFLAVAQMIVYAGAVVVLFIFVIMLLNLTDREIGRFRFSLFKLFGAFVVFGTMLALAPGVRTTLSAAKAGAELGAGYGSTKEVGRLLFGEYVLAFELTSVLILGAMVAGVVLAKKELTPKKFFSPLDWLLKLISEPPDKR